MEIDRKPYEKQFNAMGTEFQKWQPTLRELARLICPTRGQFTGATPNDGKPIDHRTVMTGLPRRCLRILASGLTSGLTSPSRPWFRVGIDDEEAMQMEENKIWLERVQTTLMDMFSRSNFYGTLYSVYEEIGLFGTGACALLEDFDTTIRGKSFTAGEYMIGTDHRGRVNKFRRQSFWTVGQLVEEFKIENVSQEVKSQYLNGQTEAWVKVNYLITPNLKREAGKEDNKNKAYIAIYWEDGSIDGTALAVGGYDIFPVLAPRWGIVTTSDVLGKGPGHDAMGDVKQLYKMTKDKLLGLNKMVDPPTQKDASVVGDVNTLPGGVTTSSASTPNAGVRPAYQVNIPLGEIRQDIAKTEQDIKETFYADLFLMVSQLETSGRTAREIVERHEEKLLMLGPVLESLESELLDPAIDIAFDIGLKTGVIPPPPVGLDGLTIKIEYISMLAQAQRMVGTTAIEQTAAFAGSLVAVDPDVMDVIDTDVMLREYGELNGVSPRIIRSPEKVNALRQEKIQQAQAQQQMAQLQQIAQGAKVLSETKVGENSALDAMMGQGIPQ